MIHTRDSDFLESQSIIAGVFVTYLVQYPVMLFISEYGKEHYPTDEAIGIASTLSPAIIFQSVTIPLLCFTSYKDPPFTASPALHLQWTKVVPKLYSLLMLVNFIVLPFLVGGVLAHNYYAVEKTNFTAPLWFIAFTNVSFLINWSPNVMKMYHGFAKSIQN